ncbi:MAG: TIGR02391 family protein [Tepidisphaeraceae bacterium]
MRIKLRNSPRFSSLCFGMLKSTGSPARAIARILADTESGLTGSQIAHLLEDCRIPDTAPTLTKWRRLHNALVEFQIKHGVGNHVVVFITRAMNPANYTAAPKTHEERRIQLNGVLAFCGMAVGEDGKIRRAEVASNLDEALARADRLRSVLRQRNVHGDVLRYCNAEILAKNYFHPVFEAMKSITAKIRMLSGLTSDGAELVDQAFQLGKSATPMLAISALDTETLRGEQRGFVSLVKGIYGTIRNPLAHNPKIEWDMTEQDALDILTMISLIHRKLDKAVVFVPPPPP